MHKKLTISKDVLLHSSALDDLSRRIYQYNKSKGFWDRERNVGEMLMLVVSELGEAVEAHRKNKFTNIRSLDKQLAVKEGFGKLFFEQEVKDTFEDEIADAIIRLLDIAGGLGIDIGWHLSLKVAYNSGRKKLHGKTY